MGDIFPSSYSPSPSPPPPPPPLVPAQTTVLFSEPVSQLPEPLPSADEIESSPHVLKRLMARCAVRVGEHYVVKYGTQVKPSEGENMIFVRQHLKNLVPRVFAIYQRPGPWSVVNTYIIMERIHGRTLEEAWGTMDEPERLKVVNSLRDAFQLLRSIPPPDYFGGLGMTKLNDVLFWARDPVATINGPFKTETELVHGIVQGYRTNSSGGERHRHECDYYLRVLPRVLQGNGRPVFTHGDFQRKNIMVGSQGEITIIDWDPSGWYPTYWEYATAMLPCIAFKDDWHRYIPKILDEFPNQFAWLHRLHVEMWG
ncbi:kinase-like domain-containing protein [Nemania sp. FL0031]|nr:kinase-like domain-containing protein [Nemania sp. FL0031]